MRCNLISRIMSGLLVVAVSSLFLVGCGQQKHIGTVSSDDNYRTWYEVFLYSYCDSDGDGIGDINGLINKLDYINDGNPDTDTDLGCDGIWLMPIMPSTSYHKYDVMDYCAIDKTYGTLEDFDNLLEECHKRGINVIIDFVMNHSAVMHPWFVEAKSYLLSLGEGEEPDSNVCPYVDYYNFSTTRGAGYAQLSDSRFYYECQFWDGMPDLNLENPLVRQEMKDAAKFWLDRGVDGFRLDAVAYYSSSGTQENIEILKDFNEYVKSVNENAYMVGEMWASEGEYAQYYASGVDSFFDFGFSGTSGTISMVVNGRSPAYIYGDSIERLQDTISKYDEDYIDAPFYTNHDMARSAGYYPGDEGEKTKLAQALNLLMSGSAFIYYGEELGMKGSGKDENIRLPMYWSEDKATPGRCFGPKDADAAKHKFPALDEQQEDPLSIFNYVKKAVKIRSDYKAISHGVAQMNRDKSTDFVCVLDKAYGEENVTLVINVGEEAQTVDVSGFENKKLVDMLTVSEDAVTLKSDSLDLPAYSIAILE